MKKILLVLLSVFATKINAQEKAVPIFKDGEAQIVEAFNDQSKWIRHDLWVEMDQYKKNRLCSRFFLCFKCILIKRSSLLKIEIQNFFHLHLGLQNQKH